MPIFEYLCRSCDTEFEMVVLKDTVPACPACKGQNLEKLLSGFAVSTEEMTQARVKRARQTARFSKNHVDKQIAEAQHLHEHVTEHMNDQGHDGPGVFRPKVPKKD